MKSPSFRKRPSQAVRWPTLGHLAVVKDPDDLVPGELRPELLEGLLQRVALLGEAPAAGVVARTGQPPDCGRVTCR